MEYGYENADCNKNRHNNVKGASNREEDKTDGEEMQKKRRDSTER